jgi:hypothetical protein
MSLVAGETPHPYNQRSRESEPFIRRDVSEPQEICDNLTPQALTDADQIDRAYQQ